MQMPEPAKRLAQRLAASDWFARIAPRFVPQLDGVLYRLTGGRVMLSQGAVPSIVLTTTGAKSGQPRHAPLAAVPYDGDWFVVASNFGRESHPAWSYNLMANPSATMTMRGEDHPVEAQLLDAAQKAEIWPELVSAWPPYDSYVERSGRDLRVFRLVRTA